MLWVVLPVADSTTNIGLDSAAVVAASDPANPARGGHLFAQVFAIVEGRSWAVAGAGDKGTGQAILDRQSKTLRSVGQPMPGIGARVDAILPDFTVGGIWYVWMRVLEVSIFLGIVVDASAAQIGVHGACTSVFAKKDEGKDGRDARGDEVGGEDEVGAGDEAGGFGGSGGGGGRHGGGGVVW